MELDLSSLRSVMNFVKEYKDKGYHLHILLNNAAVMACPYSLSTDGIELQFATNHLVMSSFSLSFLYFPLLYFSFSFLSISRSFLSFPLFVLYFNFDVQFQGHFLLTTELLDVLIQSAPSRIVCVSSMGHKLCPKEVTLSYHYLLCLFFMFYLFIILLFFIYYFYYFLTYLFFILIVRVWRSIRLMMRRYTIHGGIMVNLSYATFCLPMNSAEDWQTKMYTATLITLVL